MVRIDSLRKVAAPSLSLLQTDYKVTEKTNEPQRTRSDPMVEGVYGILCVRSYSSQ